MREPPAKSNRVDLVAGRHPDRRKQGSSGQANGLSSTCNRAVLRVAPVGRLAPAGVGRMREKQEIGVCLHSRPIAHSP